MTTVTIEMLHEFIEAWNNRPTSSWTADDFSYFKSYLSDSHVSNIVFPEAFPLGDNHYVFDSLFENVVFFNTKIFDSNMNGSEFRKCQFINIKSKDALFNETKFIDCIFTTCSITNVDICEAYIENTIICNSELTGFGFDDCIIKGLLFWNNLVRFSPGVLRSESQGAQLIGNTFKST